MSLRKATLQIAFYIKMCMCLVVLVFCNIKLNSGYCYGFVFGSVNILFSMMWIGGRIHFKDFLWIYYLHVRKEMDVKSLDIQNDTYHEERYFDQIRTLNICRLQLNDYILRLGSYKLNIYDDDNEGGI